MNREEGRGRATRASDGAARPQRARAPSQPSPSPPPSSPLQPPTRLLPPTAARPSPLSRRPRQPSSPPRPGNQRAAPARPASQDRDPPGLTNRRGPAEARSRQPFGFQDSRRPQHQALFRAWPLPRAGPFSPPSRSRRRRAPHSPGRRPRPSSRAQVPRPPLLQPPPAPPSGTPPRAGRPELLLLYFSVTLNSLSSIGLFVYHSRRGGPICGRGWGGRRQSPPPSGGLLKKQGACLPPAPGSGRT